MGESSVLFGQGALNVRTYLQSTGFSTVPDADPLLRRGTSDSAPCEAFPAIAQQPHNRTENGGISRRKVDGFWAESLVALYINRCDNSRMGIFEGGPNSS